MEYEEQKSRVRDRGAKVSEKVESPKVEAPKVEARKVRVKKKDSK